MLLFFSIPNKAKDNFLYVIIIWSERLGSSNHNFDKTEELSIATLLNRGICLFNHFFIEFYFQQAYYHSLILYSLRDYL